MLLPFLTLQAPLPKAAPPKVEMPKALRGSTYIAKIDRLSHRAGLPNLRRTRLSGTDFEIRVWTYLELAANPLSAKILRRRSMAYSALELHETYRPKGGVETKPIAPPNSGWTAFWNGLAPLLTLRDESALPPDDVWVLDGETTIVEIALPGRYRAFHHSNPAHHKGRKDAVVLVRMMALLNREFAATTRNL